ncbi:hypothetical protein ACO0LD_22965 [Undibacterium sp. Ji83W]|uniref:hypothetical protein n=1 Tax=Undibacterium sp. Ji83W TaxID=3413043 RepID=UPI003BF314A3
MTRFVLWEASRIDGANSYQVKLLFDAVEAGDGSLGASALALQAEGAYTADGITLQVKPRKIPLQLPELKDAKLHGFLFELPAGGERRLKSWTAIQAEIAARSANERLRLQKEIESFRRSMASFTMSRETDFSFLGLKGIGGKAVTSCTMEIELPGLLPETARRPERPLLRMLVGGDIKGTVLGKPLDMTAVFQLVVGLDREQKLASQFLTGIVRALDTDPVFNLPPIPLPALHLDSLKESVTKFAEKLKEKLLPLALPMPDLDGLAAEWDTTPSFTAELDANGSLIIGTAPDAKVTVSVDTKPLFSVDKCHVEFHSTHGLTITGTPLAGYSIPVPGRTLDSALTGPVTIRLAEMQLEVAYTAPTITLTQTMGRIEIRAKEDADLVLAFKAKLTATMEPGGQPPNYQLTELELIDPYPIKLVAATGQLLGQAAAELLRFIQEIHFSAPNLPAVPETGLATLFERLRRFMVAIMQWLGRQAGELGQAIAGITRGIAQLIADLLSGLSGGAFPMIGLSIEIRLDRSSFALRQLILTPILKSGSVDVSKEFNAAGLRFTFTGGFMPALIYDLQKGWVAFALIPHGTVPCTASVGTDLWLENQDGAVESGSVSSGTGNDDQPLILLDAKIDAPGGTSPALVLAGIRDGKPFFFTKLVNESGQPTEAKVFDLADLSMPAGLRLALGGFVESGGWMDGDFHIVPRVNPDKLTTLLPFLKRSGDSSSFLDQYIAVDSLTAGEIVNGRMPLNLALKLCIAGTTEDATVVAMLDLNTLQLKLEGGKVAITGTIKERDVLGMKLTFEMRDGTTPKTESEPFKQLVLDFTSGDMLLSLAPGVVAVLRYKKLSSRGQGLEFRATTFDVSRNGVDLIATISQSEPVILAGVDTPFSFHNGSLEIKSSKVQNFTLQGQGQLPPALIGDASAKVSLSLGAGKDGKLTVLAADGDIDRRADPIEAHALRFRFTLSQIGFSFKGEENPHFYFLLTGTADFVPGEGEFQNGLLKNLSKTRIKLDHVPLTSDPSVLMRHIEFLVPIEPPVSCTLFDIFVFELRGIGFMPSSPAFDGHPALSISGKVAFGFGDIPTVEIDIDQLLLSTPKAGQSLPQVRMDNLSVGLNLGTGRIKATAIAVDDSLPTLYEPDTLPANVTANGFLASGSMSITGLPDLSAAMGFMELREKDADGNLSAPRHAFFIYAQLNKLSQPIPTPCGEIYLREAGGALAFRFTLEGIARADRVTTPQELIQVLDEVSKHANDLADPAVWWPEASGDRLTLAIRLLFTLTTASAPGTYNAPREKPEKDQPQPRNPVLFDAVAALRSDGTFLMTVRAWLSVNYADWLDDASKTWRKRPLMRGYLYLSVPRRQFLARFVGDPNGYIGEHPPLPEPLKKAFSAVRWSSTLYIDESVFHYELGWPYELGYTLGSKEEDFYLNCEGGLVMRFEDGAYLQGLAFRATGMARFQGRAGGDSLGAAVTAVANFALDGKLIAYLATRNVGDSMLYGSLRIDVTVDFNVHLWVSFKVWRCEVRLEAVFAIQLTVAVAAEVVLAARSPVLGVRLMVTIGVSALGRSLRIGVGLSFNDTLLEDARTRVQRFLALGLAARYPDPEAGVPPAAIPAQPPRAEQVATGDDAVRDEADAQSNRGQRPPGPLTAEPAPGQPIGPTRFWAILFPTRRQNASGKWYVMQLVPRDLTDSDDPSLSTFYASPFMGEESGAKLGYLIVSGGAGKNFLCFDSREGGLSPVGTSADVEPYWEKPIATESGRQVTFADVIGGAFLPPLTACPERLTQPDGKLLQVTRLNDSQASGGLDAAMAKANRERMTMSPVRAEAAAIEERRSGLISAIGESAARLAADGESDTGWRSRDSIDARDFGLSFLLDEAALRSLRVKRRAGTPDLIDMTVLAWDADDCGWTSNVELFNPPENMFDRRPPRLKQVSAAKDGRITLDWDLEPTWGDSDSIYNDPEYHLKHYRICRTITGANAEVPVWRTTCKASMPLEPFAEKDKQGWRFRRPPCQFIDELAGLTPAMRNALVGKPGKAGDSRIKLDDWNISFAQRAKVQIVYTIVAVDNAGTESDPMIIEVPFEVPQRQEEALRRASLKFAYQGLPSFATDLKLNPALSPADQTPALLLVIEDPLRDKAYGGGLPAGRGDRIELLLVPERIVSAGLFGIDALTSALHRPLTPVAASLPRPGEARLTLRPGEDLSLSCGVFWRIASQHEREGYTDSERMSYVVDKLELADGSTLSGKQAREQTKALFGFDDRPNVDALRVYARISPAENAAQATQRKDKVLEAEWVACDLVMEVDHVDEAQPAQATHPIDIPLISCAVEAFEHPTDIPFAPLAARDIKAEAGRLVLTKPYPTSSLEQLCQHNPGAVLLPEFDLQRRVGIKLKWNARPSSLTLLGAPRDSSGFEALIGGYDIFSIDPTTLTAPEAGVQAASAMDLQQDMYAGHARQVGRVQLLPLRLAGMEPSETGDMAKIEAVYPSATLLQHGLHGQTPPPAGARQHSYLSAAESAVLWPSRVLGRHLMADPAHDTVDSLFAKGLPEVLLLVISDPLQPTGEWLEWLNSPTMAIDSGGVKWKVDPHEPTCYRMACQDQPFQPDQIRRLLAAMVWEGEWDMRDPAAYAGLTMRLVAGPGTLQRTDQGRAEVTVALDLVGDQHPVLTDLLAALRYDAQAGNGAPLVRRYEPVLDLQAPSKQQYLLGYFDEMPPERDPYGWAALRAFGLAACFRLYDTQLQQYVVGNTLASHVNQAFKATLAAYRWERDAGLLGAPFVDLLMSPEAVMTAVPFDAGLAISDNVAIVLEQAKGLVQVSLRPMASGLQYAANPLPVRYFNVIGTQDIAGPGRLSIAAPTAAIDGRWFSIDVIPAHASDGDYRPVTALPEALDELLGEKAFPTLSLDLPSVKAGRALALVRVVAYGANGKQNEAVFPDTAALLTMFALQDAAGVHPLAIQLEPLAAPRVLQPALGVEAFERFTPLSSARLALLAYGMGNTINPSRAGASCLSGIADWRHGLALPNKLDLPDNQRSFMQRLQAWTRRFIEHGPVRLLDGQQADHIGFSLATIARPDPWRIAPAPDGSIELLLPQKERYGKVLWYVVRPFGRYNNFAETVVPARHELSGLYRAFSPRSDQKNPFDVFAPAVLQRSEPLAAPVILSARRYRQDEHLQPAIVELVIGRHPEQVLADANIRVEAQLAFREIGVGFWREFNGAAWLGNLEHDITPRTDPAEEFGWPEKQGIPVLEPQAPRAMTNILALGKYEMDEVLNKLDTAEPDLWAGARALYVGGLPYGFRTHVLAYASAGVVVSDQVGTSFDFSDYALMLPWQGEMQAQQGRIHAGRRTSARPGWTASYDARDDTVVVHVELPLVRFIDSMPLASRKQWFGDRAAPALYLTADPGVSYRLGFEAGGGQVLEHQLELLPAPANIDETAPLYQVNPIAALFAMAADESVRSDYHDSNKNGARVVFVPASGNNQEHFALRLPLPLTAREQPKQAVELNRQQLLAGIPAADWLPLFTELPIGVPAFSDWASLAPTAMLTVTWAAIALPFAVYEYIPLKEAAAAWQGQLAPYAAHVPAALIAQLGALAALPDIGPDPQTGQLKLPAWIAGLPMAPLAPISATIDLATVNWAPLAPADCVRAKRSVIEKCCWPLHGSHLSLWQALLPPMLGAMGQTTLINWRYSNERGYGGIPRLAYQLTGSEPWAGPALPQLASHTSTVKFLVQVPLTNPLLVNPPEPLGANFDALLALLEQSTTNGALLQSLLAIESTWLLGRATVDTVVVLPMAQESLLRLMLDKLWQIGPSQLHALILHKPPSEPDLAAFATAATTALGQANGEALAALVSQLAEEQLFGAGRRMRVTCFHGRVAPEHALISRREG